MSITAQEFRLEAVRLVRQAAGIGVYTFGALTGATYASFLGLRAAAERALHRGRLDEAALLARDLLKMADQYPKDWYRGNALHHGHLILGQVALERGDIDAARGELLAAGRTPGSPQLNSFGPNMYLAQALLKAGERDGVIEYLELCKVFWHVSSVPAKGDRLTANEALDRWIEEIRCGELPDFGPQLVY